MFLNTTKVTSKKGVSTANKSINITNKDILRLNQKISKGIDENSRKRGNSENYANMKCR